MWIHIQNWFCASASKKLEIEHFWKKSDEFWEFCPKNISMGYHFFNKKHMRILCNLNLKTEKVSLSICNPKLISKIDFVQALQKKLEIVQLKFEDRKNFLKKKLILCKRRNWTFWEFCPKNISMGYHFFNKKHMRILCNLNLKTEKVSLSICELISKIDFVQALQKNLKLNSFEKMDDFGNFAQKI